MYLSFTVQLLLCKAMGWSEGEGLGRAKQGIVEPIQVTIIISTVFIIVQCHDTYAWILG